MSELTPDQVIRLWHRSYSTVDGLWFMKVEEKYGFEAALDIDEEVWKVQPKMQARLVKSMLNLGAGVDALRECLTAKLKLEEYDLSTEEITGKKGFRIVYKRCPWHELMVKSGRESLSGKVGTRICNTEYAVWAGEFGKDIRFKMQEQICAGGRSCILEFST
ncbi:MAG: L-2-amino-thiazoline-4-carboxylic acid hydrolase [Dehalococcoidia bacterium]|nr:L-2-amino-thiazoline-4-carboxylic acid hydrolase [Dehalococcoidia bacterium]